MFDFFQRKTNQDGNQDEWIDVFLVDLQGVESTSPPAFPMWYVWLYWFPPMGMFGGHRYMLGKRGCGLYVFALTLGFFGFGWIFDAFTMCCCVENLKIKSEMNVIVQDAEDVGLEIKLNKFADSKKMAALLKSKLQKHPAMSKSRMVGLYKHVQHPAIMDCCKDWFGKYHCCCCCCCCCFSPPIFVCFLR